MEEQIFNIDPDYAGGDFEDVTIGEKIVKEGEE